MPTLSEAFWYWLKLGLISFGGPAGQIAIMHRDLVEQKHWISEKRFLHALNYCMLLPGPEAQQLATYIGWLMHGKRGGLLAGILFVLPSMLMLMGLGYIYMRFGNTTHMAGILAGIKPLVVAIVLFAAYRIAKRALKHPALWLIALAAFVGISFMHVSFPIIIGLAALTGWVGQHYFPQVFNLKSSHQAAEKDYGKALLDDDTPTPTHARFSMKKSMMTLVVGLLIGLIAIVILALNTGLHSLYTQLAWFFSKAALLTFGGAYAVLPYVTQSVVTHYGWLTTQQMMDGLALGETTPGPLIMVVTFVGFVAGFQAEPLNPIFTGLAAAAVVTFFTFLPSFIFIFAGAPLIESTKENLKLGAPLTAITAAVVGVIVSLALFFSQVVFFPQQQADNLAIGLTCLAMLLLIRWNVSIIKLVGLFSMIGWLLNSSF
ncbi:MAG TPA: chromate efflux transporter [Methylophilus sp.]|nr:chromate efflux transporter [Methylophilus sp.]HQQ33654.1 chromate efflux transporter [Methylophilus sp.]